MADQPQGDRASGRDISMSSTRLREILHNLSWSQNELSVVLDFRDTASIRAMARGKKRVWPVIAAWLERLDAFQAASGFPVGILWWSEEYPEAFARAADTAPDEGVRAWLASVVAFHAAHRWPSEDWKVDEEAMADGSQAVADLRTLGLRLYGDIGRALRLDMRYAKAWQRRPRNMVSEVLDWLNELAEYKRHTGFPMELLVLNWNLSATFAGALSAGTAVPAQAGAWIGDALEFYQRNNVPVGFEPEQDAEEGFQATDA